MSAGQASQGGKLSQVARRLGIIGQLGAQLIPPCLVQLAVEEFLQS
jgi:hypothetical protein